MKKAIVLLSVLCLSASFAACGSSSASSGAPSDASSQSASSETVGGWTQPESFTGTLSSEASAAFDKAKENYDNKALTKVQQLGSQVVAGTNYMILCNDMEESRWKVAVVYEDLFGNAEISKVTDLDVGKYADKDGEAGEQGLAGGWSIYEDPEGTQGDIPEDAAAAFADALEGLTGANYKPVICLGTQLVSGTNYAILCYQTLVIPDPVTNLAIVYVYQPLDGSAEILNIYPLDLADFNQ